MIDDNAPVATDLTVGTPQNVAATFNLTATDPDSDPLTFAIVSGPANGTMTLNAAAEVLTTTTNLT